MFHAYLQWGDYAFMIFSCFISLSLLTNKAVYILSGWILSWIWRYYGSGLSIIAAAGTQRTVVLTITRSLAHFSLA